MTLRVLAVGAALGLAAALGCSRPSSPRSGRSPEASKSYDVLLGSRRVFVLRDAPGPVVSRAVPVPGQELAMHPLLSGYSTDPSEEHNLFLLLEEAKSLRGFAGLLQHNGYRLRAREPGAF